MEGGSGPTQQHDVLLNQQYPPLSFGSNIENWPLTQRMRSFQYDAPVQLLDTGTSKWNPRGLIETGGAAVAGVLLASSFVTRWVTHGSGSTMTGRQLARALRSWPGGWTRWGELTSVGLYLVPLIGCLMLATSWTRHRAVVVTRLVAGVAILLVLAILVLCGIVPLARWGYGAAATGTGAALGICSSSLIWSQQKRIER